MSTIRVKFNGKQKETHLRARSVSCTLRTEQQARNAACDARPHRRPISRLQLAAQALHHPLGTPLGAARQAGSAPPQQGVLRELEMALIRARALRRAERAKHLLEHGDSDAFACSLPLSRFASREVREKTATQGDRGGAVEDVDRSGRRRTFPGTFPGYGGAHPGANAAATRFVAAVRIRLRPRRRVAQLHRGGGQLAAQRRRRVRAAHALRVAARR